MTTFDHDLSLEIDRATVSLEEARESGDDVRVLYALAWLRKLEARIPEETHERDHYPAGVR